MSQPLEWWRLDKRQLHSFVVMVILLRALRLLGVPYIRDPFSAVDKGASSCVCVCLMCTLICALYLTSSSLRTFRM